ncbi:MAG: hypothetical protein JO245_01975 [Pseudolabrys sp.]|nr:hypothetical protein [Pseudolabrys sp.]
MNKAIRPHIAGLAFGGVFSLFHLGWAALIAAGLAQPAIDFILWLHMIKPFLIVEPFDLARAVGLVIVTGLIGYVLGGVFALLWNRLHG